MSVKNFAATCGAWFWFAITVVIFDPLLRIALLFGPEAFDKVTSSMCHSLCWSIRWGMCRLEIEGQENIPQGERVIIVANHQSLVESFLPFWFLADLRPKYVAKKALGRWIPSVSFILRHGGSCLIDRANRTGAVKAIEALGKRVNNQEVSAIIFPEGTRSTSGKISNFKVSGLQALLTNAPKAAILPMIVHNGNKVYPKGAPRVTAGSTVTVRFLKPLSRNESNELLIEKIRLQLNQAFESMEESVNK